MQMSTRNTGGNSVILGGSEFVRGETVETVSLADLLAGGTCDLLKIDIEGAEYDLLYPAGPEVLSRIGRMILEVHHVDAEKTGPKLAEFLARNGFEVTMKNKCISARNRKLNN
jgi:hypothetical protein